MDLRAIETEISAIGPVQVSSDDFEGTVASIEEFTHTGAKTLKTVKFRAENYSPGRYVDLTVLVDTESAFLSGSDDDHQVAGVQIKIEQILKSRQRRFIVACSRTIAPLIFVGASFFFGASIVAAVLVKSSRASTILALVVCAVLVALGLVFWAVGRFMRGEIMLELREARPTWFARNRDALVVQTIVGVVLLGVGYLLGRVTR